MEAAIAGVITWLITALVKKTGLSATYVSLFLSLIGGTIYYVCSNYFEVEWNEIVTFAAGAYGASQIVYNVLRKIAEGIKA